MNSTTRTGAATAGAIKSGGSLPMSRTEPNQYLIFDAQLAGGVGYSSNTYARSGSTDWTKPEGRIYWPIIARAPGAYRVTVTYNRVKDIGGGEFEVAIAGKSLRGTVETASMTPDLHNGDIITRELGTIDVPAGRQELTVKAAKIPTGKELMHFIDVTFTPVGR